MQQESFGSLIFGVDFGLKIEHFLKSRVNFLLGSLAVGIIFERTTTFFFYAGPINALGLSLLAIFSFSLSVPMLLCLRKEVLFEIVGRGSNSVSAWLAILSAIGLRAIDLYSVCNSNVLHISTYSIYTISVTLLYLNLPLCDGLPLELASQRKIL